MAQYDESGSIGKCYRRGNAIGIPFAVTIDDNTLDAGTVTVGERDSMAQETVSLGELAVYLQERFLWHCGLTGDML